MSTQASPFESLFQEDIYNIPGRTLIVTAKDWSETTEDERSVLTKMLSAVKLNLATVQIITLQNFALADLTNFNPSRILVFGGTIKEVNQLYTNTVINGVPIITAEAIDKLDDAKKKSLWVALKAMFGI